jgi:SAM-dependent methyltransferase
VEIGCGTGLNFGLVQERIGPTGRLLGVDLCADMLEQARQRVAARGWDNVELIRARATDFDFPARTPFPAGIVQGAVKSALGSSFGFQPLRQSTRSVTQLSLAIAAHTSNT